MTDIEPGQTLILRTDGASRGNPGPAAAGVVIEREDGQLVARGGHYLGILTSNQAEYRALIYGLTAIARYQPARVIARLDSDLVVQQMNGTYQVRHEALRPLFEQAWNLVRDLPEVRFVHVPRTENRLADGLANKALDARARMSRE